MLDTAQDAFMATAYRMALIVALEEFFGCVQVFGTIWRSPNTTRKSGQASAQAKRWPRWCAIASSTKGVL